MKSKKPRGFSMDPEYYFKKIERQSKKKAMDNKPLKYIIQTESQNGNTTLQISDTAEKPKETKKRGPRKKPEAKKTSKATRSEMPVFVTFS